MDKLITFNKLENLCFAKNNDRSMGWCVSGGEVLWLQLASTGKAGVQPLPTRGKQ